MSASVETLIKDLYATDGKAEIVNGAIVQLPPTSHPASHAEGEIFVSLRAHSKQTLATNARAFACCVAYLCDLPHRKSFCPDVSYYTGESSGMKFPMQPPIFAVEIRNEYD